jgi:hypothetical protein
MSQQFITRVLKKEGFVNTSICQQFIMRVLKERVCGYRHMSAASNKSSELEGLWIKTYVSSL